LTELSTTSEFYVEKESVMSTFLQKKLETNPFTFMRRMTDELDRAFGFGSDIAGQPMFYPRMWAPEIEVFERDNKFFVLVDLPGLTKEDVKIEVTHDELTIRGERKVEKEEKKKGEGFYRSERTYGSFYRRIQLPDYVKAEDAQATFKNGVLEIELPAIPVPEVKKRAVEIKG
jgi:HSP20 family protein